MERPAGLFPSGLAWGGACGSFVNYLPAGDPGAWRLIGSTCSKVASDRGIHLPRAGGSSVKRQERSVSAEAIGPGARPLLPAASSSARLLVTRGKRVRVCLNASRVGALWRQRAGETPGRCRGGRGTGAGTAWAGRQPEQHLAGRLSGCVAPAHLIPDGGRGLLAASLPTGTRHLWGRHRPRPDCTHRPKRAGGQQEPLGPVDVERCASRAPARCPSAG